VELLAPSAGIADGLAVMEIMLGGGGGFSVWVIVTAPLAPVAVSVALIVQNPTVIDAV
jgi:hypothetical protein